MASPLETFYILFKTDAEDVEKGTKKAKKSVDDLEGSIGGADKGTVTLGKKFNLLAGVAVAAFGAMLAVTQLISSAKVISAQSKDLNTLGKVLGVSTSELTNWGRAVQNAGGTIGSFNGSVRSLGAGLNDILVNGANATSEALFKMGVDAFDTRGKMKTVLTLLPELAAKFGTMNRQTALAFGSDLGLDDAMILFLMQGEAVVRARVGRQREMNRVTDDETERLARLSVKFEEFKNLISDIKVDLLIGVLDIIKGFGPALEKVRGEWESIDLIMSHFEGRWKNAKEIFSGLLKLAKQLGTLVSGMDLVSIDSSVAERLGDILGVLEKPGDLLNDLIQRASNALSTAGGSPVQAIGAAAGAGAISRSATVSVGEVNIQTQATDAEGIGAAISDELGTQLQNAIDETDDGLAA